jgi:hypothetical protein
MQLLTDMKPAVMMLTSNSCSDYDHLHTTEKEYFFFINILTLTQIYVGFFIEGMYISKIQARLWLSKLDVDTSIGWA